MPERFYFLARGALMVWALLLRLVAGALGMVMCAGPALLEAALPLAAAGGVAWGAVCVRRDGHRGVSVALALIAAGMLLALILTFCF